MALKDRLVSFGSALVRLEEAFEEWKRASEQKTKAPALYRMARDSLLLRLFLTTEQMWKTIQAALWELDGIDCGGSPKGCCRAFYTAGYVDATVFKNIIDMIATRNVLVHIYKEEEAESMVHQIDRFLESAKTVLSVILERWREVQEIETHQKPQQDEPSKISKRRTGTQQTP